MKRRGSVPTPQVGGGVDLDALQQQIADLETLIASPGWKLVGELANRYYGLRAFAEQTEQLSKLDTVAAIGQQVYALVAARQAAIHLLGVPTQLIEDCKRKLHAEQDREPSAPMPFGPDVEVSQ